jgi:hypothetical protein
MLLSFARIVTNLEGIFFVKKDVQSGLSASVICPNQFCQLPPVKTGDLSNITGSGRFVTTEKRGATIG